ncbi:MAG: sugar transferase [SAR324 cluster bacterium]|uniref:Sugar transferase n=1 Tax=SAR324 cluster bacterium TaxID=2024889 RepID=A0A2A4T354_9DELT|nr:MAG: sugar transferase [SAR324 cluster bacterium]
MSSFAPIVLFVYNRLWHTQQTLEALKKNELAEASELYIYSDEAKNEDARKSVNEVREYLKTVTGFKKVTIIKREKNWGLADSIIDGVTKIVNEYGKIIVLEDDLVTSPYFLKFMNKALEFYKDEDKVWHISGYTPPLENINENFFIKPTSCWGWATWDTKWAFFKKDTNGFLKLFDNKKQKDFNVNNSYDYYSHIVFNHQKKINTWAIFWYASVYFNNGLSLHPKKSFVQNIGHDNSGTHCGSSCAFDVELSKEFENKFSNNIFIDNITLSKLEKYYRSFKVPLHIKVLNKIQKVFKGKV